MFFWERAIKPRLGGMVMRKKVKWLTMLYYIFDLLIQVNLSSWIYIPCMMGNTFVVYGYALIYVGDQDLALFITFVVLMFLLLTCIFIISIFWKKKYLWEIPLCIAVPNITTHIIFLWSEPMAYIGLLYKILGLLLYGYAIYDRKKFSKVENTEEKPEKIENHS